jgi:hypothetical protein
MNEQEFYNRFETHKRIKKATSVRKRLHALYCQQTGRIFCVSNYTNTVRSLETILNTGVNHSCNRKNKNHWVDSISAETCIYWRYVFKQKLEPYEFVDFEEYYKCLLINEKAAALDRLHLQINFMRRQQRNDNFLQDVIYEEKHREALYYKQTKSAEDLLFLPSYSSQENISLDEAAERIILMRKFQFSLLNETEVIRIKFTKQILEENDFFNIPVVFSQFIKEAYAYGVL